MNDPRPEALQALEGLLSEANRRKLDARKCMLMIEHVALVPGWVKRVAHALSAQRTAPAVEALRQLPPAVPGVVEGLHQAFAHGVRRQRDDGQSCPALLALDFKHSRARGFDPLLQRARQVFGDGLEELVVDEKHCFRFRLQQGRGTLAGRVAATAQEVTWLHERLAKLRGTRLWLNGWCFPTDGPLGAAIQVHLVRAWLSWAAGQTETLK